MNNFGTINHGPIPPAQTFQAKAASDIRQSADGSLGPSVSPMLPYPMHKQTPLTSTPMSTLSPAQNQKTRSPPKKAAQLNHRHPMKNGAMETNIHA